MLTDNFDLILSEPNLLEEDPGHGRGRTTADGIPLAQILRDRPDVLQAWASSIDGPLNDPHSSAWLDRVAGTGPEDYANYWYETYGRAEGYTPSSAGQTSAPAEGGPVSQAPETPDPDRILHDRPDVLKAFYEGYYGPGNDHDSSAWIDRVGGSTPQAYALYWYKTFGQYEGYSPFTSAAPDPERLAAAIASATTGRTTADGVPLAQILQDRPDVFRAYYEAYYGPNNDHHSSAWVDRVGGTTLEDYANYWYETYARRDGYLPSTARPASPAASDDSSSGSAPTSPDATDPGPPAHAEDPSLDPWNHPAIYPDWQPPYPGWTPPQAGATGEAPTSVAAGEADPASSDTTAFIYSDPGSPMLPIGRSLLGAEDPLGH